MSTEMRKKQNQIHKLLSSKSWAPLLALPTNLGSGRPVPDFLRQWLLRNRLRPASKPPPLSSATAVSGKTKLWYYTFFRLLLESSDECHCKQSESRFLLPKGSSNVLYDLKLCFWHYRWSSQKVVWWWWWWRPTELRVDLLSPCVSWQTNHWNDAIPINHVQTESKPCQRNRELERDTAEINALTMSSYNDYSFQQMAASSDFPATLIFRMLARRRRHHHACSTPIHTHVKTMETSSGFPGTEWYRVMSGRHDSGRANSSKLEMTHI